MFNFQFHIPSTMPTGRWEKIQHEWDNPKYAATRAIIQHYRGSDSPAVIEIWIRKAKGGKAKDIRVKKYIATENPESRTYEIRDWMSGIDMKIT